MSPPLRDARNQAVLWNALASGLVSTVATDHAPFDFQTQKPMGRDDFTKIPNGIPSLEDRVNLLYTHGVETRPDRPANLRRGREHAGRETLRPLPAQRHDRRRQRRRPRHLRSRTIAAKSPSKTQRRAVDYSAFEGWEIEGRPSVVTVRGEVAVRDGKFTGTVGRGRFLQREPTHF